MLLRNSTLIFNFVLKWKYIALEINTSTVISIFVVQIYIVSRKMDFPKEDYSHLKQVNFLISYFVT